MLKKIYQISKIYQQNIMKKIKTAKNSSERFQNHSKDEKEKKKQYSHVCYKNLSKMKNKGLLSREKIIIQ